MYFTCNVSFASLPLFLPTIIAEIGAFTTIQSNGLSAPPYLLCFFTIILLAFLSDRYRLRGLFCGGASLAAAIGFILQATVESGAVRYFATFLSVSIFASVALLLAWTASLHKTESKRLGGYTILATVGQCGPLLGTNLFPDSDKPYYRKGMWISAASCLLVTLLSIILSIYLVRENRRLQKAEDAKTTSEASVRPSASTEVPELGFRYIY